MDPDIPKRPAVADLALAAPLVIYFEGTKTAAYCAPECLLLRSAPGRFGVRLCKNIFSSPE